VQLLIAVFVAYFFYRDGERIRRLLIEGMVRIAGPELRRRAHRHRPERREGRDLRLIGTAFAQAAVALVGFLIAGVPGAFLLAALTFVLSLVPMGPVLIWGGAAAWLYLPGSCGLGDLHGGLRQPGDQLRGQRLEADPHEPRR
jgi:predicted PurR-regulated permease PerM